MSERHLPLRIEPQDRPPRAPECVRADLLLSLATDGEIGATDRTELDLHLAACGVCRASQRVDAEVGARLRRLAAVVAPAGFAARTVAAALAERAAAATENRFLRVAAAAAFFVSLGVGGFLATRPLDVGAPAEVAGGLSARDVARVVVVPARLLSNPR